MEKEKTKNKKIEENDLGNMAGGYASFTYYTGTEDDPVLRGFIFVNEEERKLLKENGFINPYGGINEEYVNLARDFLGGNGHPRRSVSIGDEEYNIGLRIWNSK